MMSGSVRKIKNVIETYFTLRRSIGILGILLPVICLVGTGFLLKSSISAYYYTNMRDVFVGILAMVVGFLFNYKGDSAKDDWIATFCAFMGLLVILFPTENREIAADVSTGVFQLSQNISVKVHLLGATAFFAALGGYSFFIFANQVEEQPGKKRIFKSCGVTIWTSIMLMIVLSIIDHFIAYDLLAKTKLVYVMEFVMLVAFGISWLVQIDNDRKRIDNMIAKR